MTVRYVRPGLTTVRQPVHELGVLAADRLHERVSGADPERRAPGAGHRGGDPRLLRLPARAPRRLATRPPPARHGIPSTTPPTDSLHPTQKVRDR